MAHPNPHAVKQSHSHPRISGRISGMASGDIPGQNQAHQASTLLDDYENAEFRSLLKSAAVLVVDDEPGMRNFLQRVLEQRCALLEVAGSAEEAEAVRLRYHFDLLIVDIRLPGLSGLDWLSRLRERGVRTHVIYMTAYADLDMAIAALRNDADDFIMKPFRAEQMLISMQRTLTRGHIVRENALLRLQLEQIRGDEGLVGESDAMRNLLRDAQTAAASHSPILLLGETGTGKQKIAEAVHAFSSRQGPFVTINCAALKSEASADDTQNKSESSQPLLSEDNIGSLEALFAYANNGTLLFTNVEQLNSRLQAGLVSLLNRADAHTLHRSMPRPANVRVLACTSGDLQAAVKAQSFSKDLYFQLNVLPLKVPALRERDGDIRLLFEYYIQRLSADMKLTPVELLHTDWRLLESYDWPGNIRELRNLVERVLLAGALPVDSFLQSARNAWTGPGYPLNWTSEAVERAHIQSVLGSVNNNKSAAARILGVSRKTLERKQTIWAELDKSTDTNDGG